MQLVQREHVWKTQIYDWCTIFCEGKEQVKNEPQKGHLWMSQMEDNIWQVHQLIIDNWCIHVQHTSNDIEISIGSTETIIHLDLHHMKITAQWVPRLLTFDQKFTCEEVLKREINDWNTSSL